MQVNKTQQQAIEHSKGPLLIVAGAGTGKTTVITEKIKLLLSQKIDPDQILALTFTEKASQEMIGRLDEVMPLSYKEPWVSTFHTFGNRLLRSEALEIGLDPQFKILTQPQQWLFLKKHLFELDLKYYRPLGNPHRFISALITFFSRAADEDVTPTDIRLFAEEKLKLAKDKNEQEEAEKYLELALVMDQYTQLKIQNSLVDFGDLIGLALTLFRQRSSILNRYQNQFKQVLVDEFQDTNYAQYQLIKLLAPSSISPGLTVVGDDSQSIYRFRGAAISNIMQFMDDYKNATQVVLTDNYRSLQTILDGSYKLIQQNNPDSLESKLGISKNLKSNRKGKSKFAPVVVEAETGEAEVEFVIKRIYELLATQNYSYSDFAIIARANSQLEPYVEMLKQMSLPYKRIGNRGLFDQEEVKVLIQYLRVIANPFSSADLFQFMFLPDFELKSEMIVKYLKEAKEASISLWEKIKEIQECQPVVTLISEGVDYISRKRPSLLLYEFVQLTPSLKKLLLQENIDQMLKVQNLNKFLEYVKQLENGETNLNVVELVNILDDLVEGGENPSQAEVDDVDAITLTTVHSSKGLEFANVFMVSLVAGRFPSTNRKDPIELPVESLKETVEGGDQLAEERRLFYVGMTRAKDHLFLSWSAYYGGSRKWKPSGFLSETNFSHEKYKHQAQLSLLEIKPQMTPTVKLADGEFVLRKTSYSQIDTFKTCPLKFKYRYVLQVPTKAHHAISFGQTMHETLKEFHSREMKGMEVNEKLLLSIFEKNFIEEGYDSEKHKQLRFRSGLDALKNYFKVYKEKLGEPIKLEEQFSLKLAGVTLVGKIDRIDRTENGYELVDYKTGSLKKKQEVTSDDQLSIYAIAAKEVLGIETKTQAFYFIEENEKVETTRTESQLEKKKKALENTIEEMKVSDFPAKPGFPCQFCEFNKICPFVAK